MFKWLKSVFPKRSKNISLVNLNDEYEQVYVDMHNYTYGTDLKPKRDGAKKGNIYVLDFNGDVSATDAHGLSVLISGIISFADPTKDSVLVRLTSPGGMVHSYGYAASQLERLKDAKIKLMVSVDKVAASGGYMMACVADVIIAAPFAIIGSIGVVSEFPNVHNLLNQIGIEYKQYTAGKYKRTVGMMSPITSSAEEKFKEDLNSTYNLFKDHISKFRPSVDIETVATGEHWYASKAIDYKLVDVISTSDSVIQSLLPTFNVIKMSYVTDKTWMDKIKSTSLSLVETMIIRAYSYYMYLKY